ncbi:MAG: hypothetical protein RLZZ179_2476 [Verrucomicrobiota bacterium]|jgi:hypothetical protein
MVIPAFLLSTGTRSKSVPALSLPQSPTEKDSSESATMPDAGNGSSAPTARPIPAWASGPGYRCTNPASPVGAPHSGRMERAFSPSGMTQSGYLGRWPRLVWLQAFGPRATGDRANKRTDHFASILRRSSAPTARPIPAWASGPGYRCTNPASPVGALHSGRTERAFSPSGMTQSGYLGRWPRLVWLRAFGPREPQKDRTLRTCRPLPNRCVPNGDREDSQGLSAAMSGVTGQPLKLP